MQGVFGTAAEAIAAAKTAQASFVKLGFAKRREIIEAIKEASLANAKRLADLAVQDTQMGNAAHKVMKNEGAVTLSPGVDDLQSEAISRRRRDASHRVRPLRRYQLNHGPPTNPTSTVINHAIVMLSAGNAVVFSPHPNARDCTEETMHVINEAIVKAGAPANLLTSVANASLRTAKEIMEHPDIAMLVATGGASVVRAALSSGKKAIAAGPGNPPAIIDETADLQQAARHVIAGTSFDNNLLCIGEKALFVVDSVANETIQELTRNGGHLLGESQREALEAVVTENGEANKEYIGKDTTDYFKRRWHHRTSGDGRDCRGSPGGPRICYQRVSNADSARRPVVAISTRHWQAQSEQKGGRGHTAVLHTNNTKRITQFTKAMDCSVVVINAPSYASCGLEGEGFLAMTIAGPTGEGFTRPRTFTRQRRLTVANNLSVHTL